MINDSNSNHVVARFYCAIALVSALSLISSVSFAAAPVIAEVVPGTTMYSVTNRTISHPINTTVSAANDVRPYVSRVPNGLAQSAAGDLIVATKEGSLSTRFTGRFIVPTPALKAAAKSVVRSAPYLGYGLLAYEGINAVANSNGWYIDWSTEQLVQYLPVESWHPGLVQFNDQYPIDNSRFDFPFPLLFTSRYNVQSDLAHILSSLDCVAEWYGCTIPLASSTYSDEEARNYATSKVLPILGPLMDDKVIACSVLTSNPEYQSCYIANSHAEISLHPIRNTGNDPNTHVRIEFDVLAFPSHVPLKDNTTGQYIDFSPYGLTRGDSTVGWAPSELGGETPVTHEQLEQAIDSQYQPYESDWDAFFEEPDFAPDAFILDPVPSVTGEARTSTATDSVTGETVVSSTSTDLEFSVNNAPSGIPNITIKEVSKDKEFVNGLPTKDNVTETIRPPLDSTNQLPSSGSGSSSGSSSGVSAEFPAFCSWADIVCGFIDWVQYEPDLPDLPDEDGSGLLSEVPITNETFTFSAPNAACPAPLVLNLSQFGSREVSYQPLCDLADTMKFLYLSLMSFAAAVLLHRSIAQV